MLQTIYQPLLLPKTHCVTQTHAPTQYKYVAAHHIKIISPKTFPELKDIKQEHIFRPYVKTANYSKLRQKMQHIYDKYQNYQEYEISIRVAEEVSYFLYNYTLAMTFVIWRWFI